MKKMYNPKPEEWNTVLQRPTQTVADIEDTVNSIFAEVSQDGDFALKKYTQKFDGVVIEDFSVSDAELQEAKTLVSDDLKEAIQRAKHNIEVFHRAQKTDKIEVETTSGVACWQEKRPIQKVGLYIPGGTAPLFSTILMLAIPANIAGCKEIVLSLIHI